MQEYKNLLVLRVHGLLLQQLMLLLHEAVGVVAVGGGQVQVQVLDLVVPVQHLGGGDHDRGIPPAALALLQRRHVVVDLIQQQ